MGRVCFVGGDPHSALRQLYSARQYAEEACCDSLVQTSAFYITVVSANVGNRSAVKDALFALEGSVRRNPTAMGETLLRIADAVEESRFGSGPVAQAMLLESISKACSVGLAPSLTVVPLMEAAKLYESQLHLDSAAYCFRRLYDIGIASGQVPVRGRALENLIRIHRRRGDMQEAEACRREFAVIADSLPDKAGFLWAVSKIDAENERKTSEDMDSLASERSLYVKMTVSVVCFVLMVVLFVYLHRNYKRRRIEGSGVSLSGSSSENRESSVSKGRTPPAEALFIKIETVVSDEANFSDCNFDLTRLAYLCQSNTHYVSEAIRECAGTNFRPYLNYYCPLNIFERLKNV